MPGPGTTERGQDRQTAILRAALRVIGECGVHRTTHRKVAEAADVAPATTTYYFATLDELLEEALRLFVREEVAALRRATSELEGAATLEEVARRVAGVLAQSEPVTKIAQFELYLEAARRPALREAAAECVQAYEGFARAALEGLGSPAPGELAPVFVAFSDGLGLHRLATGEEAAPDRVADRLAALFALTHEPAGALR